MLRPWWRAEPKFTPIPLLAIGGRKYDRLFQARMLRRRGLDVQQVEHRLVGYFKCYVRIPQTFSTIKAAGLAYHLKTHRALRGVSHVTNALRHHAGKGQFPAKYAFKRFPIDN